MPHRRQQRRADVLLGRPGVVQQAAEVDIDDAAGVLGPLAVPSDPVQRLGDAAQHGGAPACCCCCCCCCISIASEEVTAGSGPPGWGKGAGGRAAGRRSPASTQVSFDPPPWLEFTTSEPSGSATRVSPPGSTHTSSPSLTANGRRSTWRGANLSSIWVGTVDNCTTGCAIQPRGSLRIFLQIVASSFSDALGPKTIP